METELELYYALLEKHGVNSQIAKTIEELTELSLALQHNLQGKSSKDQVIEEIADCLIMLMQMRLVFCKEEKFSEVVTTKLMKAAKTLD